MVKRPLISRVPYSFSGKTSVMTRSAAVVSAGCGPVGWRDSRAQTPDVSCRRPTKQRHTDGCPAIEVRILCPFHPRSCETIAVVGARRHAGIAHFIIRQPDLTLALRVEPLRR